MIYNSRTIDFLREIYTKGMVFKWPDSITQEEIQHLLDRKIIITGQDCPIYLTIGGGEEVQTLFPPRTVL